MRHRLRNAKLGRNGSHRNAMMANLVKSLIKNKRVTTTLAKAKAVAPVAEKMVTLAKKGSLNDRRLASARLQYQSRNPYDHKTKDHKKAYRMHHDVIRILFEELGPQFKDRNGGYTRIVRLAEKRRGDAGEQAILMWVEGGAPGGETKADTVTQATEPAIAEAEVVTKEEPPVVEAADAPSDEESTPSEETVQHEEDSSSDVSSDDSEESKKSD